MQRQKITDEDTEEEEERKELLNRCLINRRPYFFKHRYKESKREYEEYKSSRDIVCKALFGLSVDELKALSSKTEEQIKWLGGYQKFCPLVESDSPMNMLCRYIESIDFHIVQKIRSKGEFDYRIYIDEDAEGWHEYKDLIIEGYERHLRDWVKPEMLQAFDEERIVGKLKESLSFICSNPVMVCNCLVEYLCGEKKGRGQDILWRAYGRYMERAAVKKTDGRFFFPLPDENGDVVYLEKRYRLTEVDGNAQREN